MYRKKYLFVIIERDENEKSKQIHNIRKKIL